MSKKRQREFPDGSYWVRTYPVNYLHDVTASEHSHEWHQLTHALEGHLELETPELRALVPRDRAVFVPAGMMHLEKMRAPVSVRTLYIAPGALRWKTTKCRTLQITPLLRELVLQTSRLGVLDRRKPVEKRLMAVLFDQIASAAEVDLTLPMPRSPHARRFAALLEARPDDGSPIAEIAQRSGASLRTLERSFVADTGVRVGEWRRRFRLLHALRLLESGAAVTSVALDVGYASTSAFTAAFTRHFGVSPTRRRRS